MSDATPAAAGEEPLGPPRESLGRLFLRFLRFGALAWGGPVAQIGMLQHELVERERWVSRERFLRALAAYQALPGPEAHELCVWFGMLARGRAGAILAGLGFMLPGFVLMMALTWAYLAVGLDRPWIAAAFVGIQAAVVALVARAVHRIASHALRGGWLLLIAAAAFVAALGSLHFAIALALSGLAAWLLAAGRRAPAALAVAMLLAASALAGARDAGGAGGEARGVAVDAERGVAVDAARGVAVDAGRGVAVAMAVEERGAAAAGHAGRANAELRPAGEGELLASGLKAGLLTFGGAYTAIAFLEADAVDRGRWMTRETFLDGLALGGVLPAPFIIFTTFVGQVAGGPLGALIMTIAVFAPAFAFTLFGHGMIERVVERPGVRAVLEGVTAGVVGLIAATLLELGRAGVTSPRGLLIFALALAASYRLKHRAAVALIVLASGAVGIALA